MDAAAAAAASSQEATWWARLRAGGDDGRAREALLALHMPYSRTVAATYYGRRFHDEIEFGDYLQFASLGLLEAMERFDPARGVQFRTFAARRMHGAILNGIERLTEKQQQIALRQRLRAERVQAVAALAEEEAGGAGPVHDDPARLMKFVSEVGIGLAVCWMLEGTAMVDHPEAAASVPFYRSSEIRELRQRLLQAVDHLPPQERLVLRNHYLQEVPFDQIAATMQLTKGRISQIHKQGLLRLRRILGERCDWDVRL